ncbi:hypothetical protein PHMEG_00037665, partial [Phytophthora megakarya]
MQDQNPQQEPQVQGKEDEVEWLRPVALWEQPSSVMMVTAGSKGKLLQRREMDAALRDDEKAARYVETLRPTMAAARFVRAERERELAEREVRSQIRQSGEGGDVTGPTMGIATTAVTDVEIKTNMIKESVVDEKWAVGDGIHFDGVADVVTSVSSEDECMGGLASVRLASVRLARKNARKAEKQHKMKVRLMRRRRERRTEGAEQRQAAVDLQERRQREANMAIRRIAEHDGSDVEFAEADDGLPTATMMVAGHGDKVDEVAPVDYVEGIGGFLLDVVGVWRFEMRIVFDEIILVDACIGDGCAEEFLIGVDFMKTKGATMDFERNEVRYHDGGRSVVIPFRTYGEDSGTKVATVRMVKKAQLPVNTVTPIEVSVAPEDGEQGMFVPTKVTGSVLLAATITTAKNGRA